MSVSPEAEPTSRLERRAQSTSATVGCSPVNSDPTWMALEEMVSEVKKMAESHSVAHVKTKGAVAKVAEDESESGVASQLQEQSFSCKLLDAKIDATTAGPPRAPVDTQEAVFEEEVTSKVHLTPREGESSTAPASCKQLVCNTANPSSRRDSRAETASRRVELEVESNWQLQCERSETGAQVPASVRAMSVGCHEPAVAAASVDGDGFGQHALTQLAVEAVEHVIVQRARELTASAALSELLQRVVVLAACAVISQGLCQHRAQEAKAQAKPG